MDKSERFVLLDGLRGLAAFSVIGMHFWFRSNWLSGINLAVDFFFALSGFVLGKSLFNHNRKSRARFIWLRILRLWPMLLPVFLVLAIMHNNEFLRSRFELNSPPIHIYIGAFMLFQIFWIPLIALNYTLWSLSAEWFTNLLASVLPSTKYTSHLWIGIGLIIETIGITLGYSGTHSQVENFAISFGRAVAGFFVGILLSQRKYNSSNIYIGSVKRIFIIIFVLLCVCVLYTFSLFAFLLAPPIFYFVIREFSSLDESHLNIITRKVLLYLGRTSYGLYVWSFPLYPFRPYHILEKLFPSLPGGWFGSAMDAVSFIGLILIVTEICIRFIEVPIQKWGKKVGPFN